MNIVTKARKSLQKLGLSLEAKKQNLIKSNEVIMVEEVRILITRLVDINVEIDTNTVNLQDNSLVKLARMQDYGIKPHFLIEKSQNQSLPSAKGRVS